MPCLVSRLHPSLIAHHLELWESRKPEVVAELRKSLYVDDLISGGTTLKKAQQMKQEATEIFRDATFTLHKWYSNTPELEELKENASGGQTFTKQQTGTPSVGDCSLLGLLWKKDVDKISVSIPTEKATTTKRGILQKLAKTYDPLGLASPLTLQGKMVYREVCETKLSWDAPLQGEQRKMWLRWEDSLPDRVSAPRTLARFREDIESKGVSSAVYAIVRQKSGMTKGLVAAKARLAKQGLTIPRLELVSTHMTWL